MSNSRSKNRSTDSGGGKKPKRPRTDNKGDDVSHGAGRKSLRLPKKPGKGSTDASSKQGSIDKRGNSERRSSKRSKRNSSSSNTPKTASNGTNPDVRGQLPTHPVITPPYETFKNFHKDVLAATDKFFKSRPWSGESVLKFNKWAERAAKAYEIRVPEIVIMTERTGVGIYNQGEIQLHGTTVYGLFFLFRIHYQVEKVMIHDFESARIDAQNWATSLYYTSRPELFMESVVNGKIRLDERGRGLA